MRRSEKVLLAILVLGLLVWQGGRLVNRLLFEPIRQSRAESDRLDGQITEQQVQSAELSRTLGELERWQQRSLPPDPLTAQRLYQQWLTDLAFDSNFASVKVYPDRVISKNDACMGVLVSINAEATLDQLCLFLNRFYRTDLAHQLTALNIDSTRDRGDPVLQVTLMAEGLSLRSSPTRQRLFPTGTLDLEVSEEETTIQIAGSEAIPVAEDSLVRIGGEYLRVMTVTGTEWTVQRGADRSLPRSHTRGELVELVPMVHATAKLATGDYTNLVESNPFAKPTPIVVERAPPPQEETPEIDAAEFTYLVAAFAQDDQRQAWLYDRLNNENVVIDAGQAFSVAGVEGVVQSIGDDFVVLNSGSTRWRLRLGKNLRSMERLPATEGDETPPTPQD
jgi:hypothetical protein